MRTALANARNISIRRAALDALAMLGHSRTIGPIFQKYASKTGMPTCALRRSKGWGESASPRIRPIVQARTTNRMPIGESILRRRLRLVNEGKVDSPSSPAVLPGRKAGHQRTGEHCCHSLLDRACAERTWQALFPQAGASDEGAERRVVPIFAASRKRDVIPALKNLSQDIDPDVALAASNALRIMKKPAGSISITRQVSCGLD